MAVPQYLPDAIETIHAGMQEEQDPRHVQTLATCLRALTAIQADYMQQGQAGGGNGGAAAAQGPPDAGGGAPDPRAAIMAMLGGGGQ